MTNLYAGTGDPCAGQERENGRKEGIVRVELLESAENLGDEPPTGSETKGVGLACMQGLGLPGLDKTEKRERPMALMGSRCLLEQGTLEQTHRQALREVYEKTGL